MKAFYQKTIMLLLLMVLSGLLAQAQKNDYQSGIIHVKLKEAYIEKIANRKISNRFGIEMLDQTCKELSVSNIKRVFREAGKYEEAHKAFGLHLWYEIRYDNKSTVEEAISKFKVHKQFEIVEPVRPYHHIKSEIKENKPQTSVTKSSSAPNDPEFESQWNLENIGQFNGKVGADIKAIPAWEIESGKPNVIVAVIDQAIDIHHPDLASAIWVNQAEIPDNDIDDDQNGYIDDIHGYSFADHDGDIIMSGPHGTHVGGTIGALTNNEIGVAGVAGGNGTNGGVKLMSLAVFGTVSAEGFPEAMVYAADNGAVISQNSWGGGGTVIEAGIDYFIARAGLDNTRDNYSNNIQIGPMAGGVVTFASGNNGTDRPYDGYPSTYAPVLAVVSTENHDIRSIFSNYGSWVDICAPGEIYSTMPDESYGWMSGTSMACPHISGVAALLVSKFQKQGLYPAEIKSRLLNGADNIDADNWEPYAGQLGVGRVNAYQSLSKEYIADNTAPNAIADVSVAERGYFSIKLGWTNPDAPQIGDRIDRYELRYSTEPITEENFDDAPKPFAPVFPTTPGKKNYFTVEGLGRDTTYYFALKAYDISGNESGISNLVSGTVAEPPLVNTFPYANDFEQPATDWRNESSNVAGWEQGNVLSPFFNGAYEGEMVWSTSLAAFYEDGSQYLLYSPAFDFSEFTEAPMLSFALAYHTEPDYDLIIAQYSIDHGQSWSDIPLDRSENGFTCLGCSESFPSMNGWEDFSDWKVVATQLTGLEGQAHVMFRIGLITDAAMHYYGGASIDNFRIQSSYKQGAIVTANGPDDRVDLTDREPYTIEVANSTIGEVIDEIELVYNVSGPLEYEVRETHSALNLQPSEVFRTVKTLDFSGGGLYTVSVTANIVGDNYRRDNKSVNQLVNSLSIKQYPFHTSFEEVSYDWVNTSNNKFNWEVGTPLKAEIDTALSGINAWGTTLDRLYEAGAQHVLYSPVFDFSDLDKDPWLSFGMIYNISAGDLVTIDYSFDGSDWQPVVMESATGEYNCIACAEEFSRNNGWNGISGGGSIAAWNFFQTNLKDMAGQAFVQFRISLLAASRSEGNQGLAIDDFRVTLAPMQSQRISFERLEEIEYTTQPVEIQASATSTFPITLISKNKAIATINQSALNIHAAGDAKIVAFQAGNDTLAAAMSAQILHVIPASQTISFELDDELIFEEGLEVTLEASSTSGLQVRLTSSDTLVAKIEESVLSILKIGTATITAVQEGNRNYKAADTVEQTISIIEEITGIDGSTKAQFTAYPNPSNRYITLQGINDQQGKPYFKVMALDGKLIGDVNSSSESETSYKLDLGYLKSGVYLIKIVQGDKQQVVKVIKE